MRHDDVRLKTSIEVTRIRKTCGIVSSVLDNLEDFIKPGITTQAIETFCREQIDNSPAEASMPGYNGYPGVICTSVNSIAVHGIPDEYELQNGDIITVDIILNVDGWHGDSARTYAAGSADHDSQRLIKAAREATKAGIAAAKAGGRFGDIGFAVEETASRWGCTVLESLAGHGIGRNIHEDPVVMHIGEKGTGLPIVPGMVFTVEPVLTLGNGKTRTLKDNWAIVTCDGRAAAQFEHTVAVFGSRTEVLTGSDKYPL